MNTIKILPLLLLFLLISCSSTPKVDNKQGYRDYKLIVSQCTGFVIDNPSNDVLRFAQLDDPAIGKIMDGEIFKCVDMNMEMVYDN